MLEHMRTSIIVNDHLLAQARHKARELGLSLSAFISRAIQRDLTSVAPKKRRPFRLVTVKGGRLLPGLSWEKLEHQVNDLDQRRGARK